MPDFKFPYRDQAGVFHVITVEAPDYDTALELAYAELRRRDPE